MSTAPHCSALPSFRYQAVLWDLDGTLADSEPVHERSFTDACQGLDLDLPDDFHTVMLGKSDDWTQRWLCEHAGLGLSHTDWLMLRHKAYLARLGEVQPIPASVALWHRLAAAGVRQAVVSNSDRRIVMANLERLGLMRPSLVTVSRNDVRVGKPDPECYRRAAYLLGVDPAHTAAVEDSATGLTAARAAGLSTYMMPSFDLAGSADDNWAQFAVLDRLMAPSVRP